MPPGFGGDLEFDLIFKAVDGVSGVLETIGKTMESVITTTADWQTNLQQLQANTTLNTSQIAQLGNTIQQMASKSGAPMEQLSQAFMHATDLGFGLADATKVVTAGMESAISTGSNVSDVVNVLSLQMHDFSIGANQAGEAMNVLHLAAAQSNTTLESFVDSTSRAVTTAANLGIPLTQVDAALAALSRHMDISQASTALAGEFTKLLAPSQAVQKELALVYQHTGVDLPFDFSAAGLQAKGLTGILADLHTALAGNNADVEKLIPATRGGLASLVLLGTASGDYNTILKSLNATMAGETNPTQQAYNDALQTFNQQMAIVSTNAQILEIAVGNPLLKVFSADLRGVVGYIHDHQAEVKTFATTMGTDMAKGVQSVVTAIGTHGPEIEKFVKNFTGDVVTDVPKLATDFGTLATNIGTLAVNFQNVNTAVESFTSSDFWKTYTTNGSNSPSAPGNTSLLGGLFTFYPNSPGGQAVTGIGNAIGTIANLVGLGARVVGATTVGGSTSADAIAGPGLGRGLYTPLAPLLPYGPAWTPQLQGYAAGAGEVNAAHAYVQSLITNNSPGARHELDLAHSYVKSLIEDQKRQQNQGSGLPDPVKLAAAVTQTQQQFLIDQLTHAPQVTLTEDVKNILMAMKADGATATAMRLTQLQDLAQISKATTSTAAITTNWRTFTPYQSATEGSTIAGYGLSSGQNTSAQIIATLRQQIANDERQITLLTSLLTSNQRQELAAERSVQAEMQTAQNTSKMLSVATTPHQNQNPLSGHGLTTSGRR